MPKEVPRMHLLRAAILLAWLAPACLFAQYNSSIEGNITDPTGAVVPGAKITVTNNDTGLSRSIVSSGEGFYRIVNLALGRYTVAVESAGFRYAEQRDVPLAAGETARVNFALEVGPVGEKVTVEAQTPQVE